MDVDVERASRAVHDKTCEVASMTGASSRMQEARFAPMQ